MVAEKELEGRLKDEILKKVCPGKKKKIIGKYIFQGMKRDQTLSIDGFLKHQYYYKPAGGKPIRKPSSYTSNIKGEVVINKNIVMEIAEIKTLQPIMVIQK